jgi:HK97 gp10 family phage protein
VSKPAYAMTYNAAAANAMFDADAEAFRASARPAAQAMSQVMYDAVKFNAARIRKKTGRLHAAIYQAFSSDSSRAGLAVYHVSWNARKAPHGHLVEFGHLQRYEITYDKTTGRFTTHKDRPLPTPKHVAARPFFRPAISQSEAAYKAGAERFDAELRQRGVKR